jgi:cytochrome d ubiquinol oxidase subunit I
MFVPRHQSCYLLRGRDTGFALRSFAVASGFGLASALSVIVLGDESGYTTGETQKGEDRGDRSEWQTQKPPASFMIFGIPTRRRKPRTTRSTCRGCSD